MQITLAATASIFLVHSLAVHKFFGNMFPISVWSRQNGWIMISAWFVSNHYCLFVILFSNSFLVIGFVVFSFVSTMLWTALRNILKFPISCYATMLFQICPKWNPIATIIYSIHLCNDAAETSQKSRNLSSSTVTRKVCEIVLKLQCL